MLNQHHTTTTQRPIPKARRGRTFAIEKPATDNHLMPDIEDSGTGTGTVNGNTCRNE
ncbi:MAG: hypothetical protein QF755_06375 [Candidatus Peribacteraceae bacterium]|jgi:hypothetical protein|nr:hypothetical protein [Candidatus Peribacteraceae bacterium]